MESKRFFGCWFPARLLWLVTLCIVSGGAACDEETWVLIDTGELTLSIMRGEEPAHEFDSVSIGRNGATASKVFRDQKTPLGTFRIVRINHESSYYRYFGLDYPDLQYALRAFDAGVIDAESLDAIRAAHEQGREPPADTPLGGYIGIHGLGDGDARFHEDFNWTEGCIALTNAEIDELARWVGLGTLVLII